MPVNSAKPKSILLCTTDSTEEGSAASTAYSISPLDQNADAVVDNGNEEVNSDEIHTSGVAISDSNHVAPFFQEIDYMIAPSTKEAKENERYARKVGINFSINRGDYLTLYAGLVDDESILTEISATLSASPQYGKKDDHFTFREMYGDVNQILENGPHANGSDAQSKPELLMYGGAKQSMESVPTEEVPNVHCDELITPRTRTQMIDHNQVVETLRERAAILSKDWVEDDNLAPSLARKLRDFEFAQKKRRKMFGKSRKWGILGLYDFLSAVRQDVEWAEDAGFRRSNCLPYLCWSDFIECKQNGTRRPFFAYSILVICTLTLIISIGLNGWAFESFSTNPSLGPSPQVLMQMGAKQTDLIVNSYEIWRIFSPMILHGGIIHFLLNCFAIFYIGRAVEQNHGTISTAILFIVPSVGSTIVSAIFLPQFISVGASGGIFGLVGACVADIAKNRKLLFSDFINKGRSKRQHVYVVLVLVLDVFLNMLMGLTPYTDNFMHLGGFVLGFICASTMLSEVDIAGTKNNRFRPRAVGVFSRFFGLLVCCVCIVAASVILFHGDGVTSPCKSCGVISCVSFPPWNDYDDRWYYCDDCGSVVAYGRKNPQSGEYVAIEMDCPRGNTIVFSLDGYDNDKESLRENLPFFCRDKCMS